MTGLKLIPVVLDVKKGEEMNNDNVTFTVKCTMKRRWVPYFISMLERMQYLGGIGSSRYLVFFSDGDGDFRPVFKIDGVDKNSLSEPKLIHPEKPTAFTIDTVYDAG